MQATLDELITKYDGIFGLVVYDQDLLGSFYNEKKLIGPSLCIDFRVEGVTTAALLDTGSTVSTVTDIFHRQKLEHLTVRPLQEMLRIESADGQLLP